ncbi:MAG: hypothetical protein AAFW46_15310 [Pseudomonadota bacterium]
MKKIKTILVHGTFARHAAWDNCAEEGFDENGHPQKDSVFVGQLRKRLAERDVELMVEPFHWSGENSHQARREAALKLNERINTLEDQDARPDGLFVIGHSHGGTVARLAINLDPTDIDPDGVITFGSPFVRFEPRPIRKLMTALVWVMRVALLAGILAAGVLALASLGGDNQAAAIAAGGFALGGLVFAIFIDRAIRRFREAMVETQAELTEQFDPPGRSKTKYLNYHARFDEAGVLLRFWSTPTWVFHTLISTLVNTSFLIVLTGVAALIYFALAFGGPYVPGLNLVVAWLGQNVVEPILGSASSVIEGPAAPTGLEMARWLPAGVLVAGVGTIIALTVAALVVGPIGVFLPWFLRKQNIAFGGEKPSWSIASDINVDRMASDNAELRFCFMPRAWMRGQWQHNYYYQDPKVVDEVAQRLAHWDIRPSRPWNLEGWLLWFIRFLFQAFIVVSFVLIAFAMTSVFAEGARDPSGSAPAEQAPTYEAPASGG